MWLLYKNLRKIYATPNWPASPKGSYTLNQSGTIQNDTQLRHKPFFKSSFKLCPEYQGNFYHFNLYLSFVLYCFLTLWTLESVNRWRLSTIKVQLHLEYSIFIPSAIYPLWQQWKYYLIHAECTCAALALQWMTYPLSKNRVSGLTIYQDI